MITHIKNNPIKLLLVCLLGVILYLILSAPPGYCSEQKRFLSDEEFIEIAVRDEFNTGRMNIDGSDASIRTFHAKHPNCCHVDRKAARSFMDKLFGAHVVVVQVIYEVNEKNFNETKEKYYEDNLVIGTCGRMYGSDSYGTGKKEF